MKNLILSSLLLFLSLMQMSQTASASLIVNGSFEQPDIRTGTFETFSIIPGWVVSFGGGIEIQDNVAGSAFSGEQFVELDSTRNSGMQQNIATLAGQEYVLDFAYSARPGVNANSNTIEVIFDGVLLDTISASGVGLSDTDWSIFSYNITATDSLSTLEFRAAGASNSRGGYLDAVRLSAVPLPPAVWLFGSGLLLLFRVRKSSSSSIESAQGT